MISLRKSLRRWSVTRPTSVLVFALAAVLAGCAVKTRESLNAEEKARPVPGTGDVEEYSIKQDRSHLEELRKDIPEPVRRENDELALVLGLMKDYNTAPSEIRSRFDRVYRKQRDKFNKDLRRERDEYSRTERKKRDDFLRELKDKRTALDRTKPDRQRRDLFYQRYREDRDRFFNEAREQRMDKESEWRQRNKDFEEYLREKRGDFEDELRSYTKRYYEYQSAKRLQKQMENKASDLERRKKAEEQNPMLEFDRIYTKPANQLKTDE